MFVKTGCDLAIIRNENTFLYGNFNYCFVTLISSAHCSTIKDAEKQGIKIHGPESIYKSAVHSDASLAVFKTDSEPQKLLNVV